MTEDLSLYLRGDPLTSGQVMACPAPTRLRGSQIEQIAYGNGAQGRVALTQSAAIDFLGDFLAETKIVHHPCYTLDDGRNQHSILIWSDRHTLTLQGGQ